MIRKIFTLDKYSAVIALPRELLRKVGLRRGQKVEVIARGKKIQIKDAK
jgi:bifunctional DNA-binding transcriptional regulator/antitoxin component of YhaV-PrlF toxin-antitoxin module